MEEKQAELKALLEEVHKYIHTVPEPYRSQLHDMYIRLSRLTFELRR